MEDDKASMDEERRNSPAGSITLGGLLGVVAGFGAVLLAIMSAGAGHGDYAAARALFPLPMLTTLAEGDTIGPISTALALAQFPLYGALLGYCRNTGTWLAAYVVAAIHLAAAVVAFSGAIPNFS